MRTKRLLAVAVVVGLIVYLAWPVQRPPKFPLEHVKSLDIKTVRFDGKEYIRKSSTSTDVPLITALLQVMQSGKGTGDHKCGDVGTLSFHLESGPPLTIGILPGHHPAYYEYRLYSSGENNYDVFKVDRAALLAAMTALGQADLDQGSPE